jgi:hypothetical protein
MTLIWPVTVEGNNEVISNLSAAKHTSLQYSNLFQKYPNVLNLVNTPLCPKWIALIMD